MGFVNFHLSLYLHGKCSTCIFTSLCPAANSVKPKLSAYFSLVSERGPYMFCVVLHQRRRLGPSIFLKLYFFITVIYPWLADLQPAPWPKSLKDQLAILEDSLVVCFFFLLFFLLSLPLPEISLSFSLQLGSTISHYKCTYSIVHDENYENGFIITSRNSLRMMNLLVHWMTWSYALRHHLLTWWKTS